MAEKTDISWTDATFNPWWGCAKVSPACDHCYAERDSKRFAAGKVLWGVDAERRTFDDKPGGSNKHWDAPLRWARTMPAKLGRRPRVFCASMADVFDKNAPEGARDRLWKLIEATPELDWLLLTKRVGNVRGMVPPAWLAPGGWPAHVRIGSTIINQEEADRDIGKLLALNCPNFLSIEPMLGPVELTVSRTDNFGMNTESLNTLTGRSVGRYTPPVPYRHSEAVYQVFDRGINWVICGGESGPHARPMHPDWVRSLMQQCKAAGVAFHLKQITERGRPLPMAEWPGDLRVQEFPDAR